MRSIFNLGLQTCRFVYSNKRLTNYGKSRVICLLITFVNALTNFRFCYFPENFPVISMANPVSSAAIQDLAAAIRVLADTLQEPLLQAARTLSQVVVTLASLTLTLFLY